MSRWFRHYAGMMRDEKLVRAAVRSKQSVERVVWVWGAILESASEINDGGKFEFDEGEAAYFLRCDESELLDIVSALMSLGRISEGVVVRWGDRQFDSDKSRDRQKRYRERLKASRDGESDVTPTSRDGEVTPQESDTDTDTELEPNGSLSETSSDDRPVAKRAIAYPKLFEAFWSDYPRTPNMSKKEAFDAWRKLSEDDRAACHRAVQGYVAFLKTKPDLETIHACRFISKRRFEGFVGQPSPAVADDERWTKRLFCARQQREWSSREWGPPPGAPGCLVPRHLLEHGDGVGWAEWKPQAA